MTQGKARLTLTNRQARWLWLAGQGLGQSPTGPLDLVALIDRLGLVQLDTIQVVARAHHHILWSRNQNYREPMLDPLYRRDRAVFEHFTHDASILPMRLLPLWERQFRRMAARVGGSNWWKNRPDAEGLRALTERIAREGPLCSRDFETTRPETRQMWARPPHKIGLDLLWFSGELATCHRRGFTKYYDLAERVFPPDLRHAGLSEADQTDGLCNGALDRMGFGTLGEVRKFWDATEVAEVRDWAARADLVPVRVETADGGGFDAVAPADIEARLAALAPPTSRLRILNPFDPVIRDRNRLLRLFGFEYRNEMFVPAAKRKWGYYVFPLLEGDRLVGRLEAKADRRESVLRVLNLWQEPGARWTPKRQGKLEAELSRLARFCGVETVSRV